MFLSMTMASIVEIANVNLLLQKYVIIFLTAMFVLVAGLRYETGVDWLVYTNMFRDTPAIDQITDSIGRSEIFSSVDYGYCLFISLVKYLGGSIQVVFLIISFASSLFLYKSLKTYSDGRVISMLLYFSLIFFILDMSGLRQGFALSIFFYALRYIQKREFLPYFGFMMLAASFHWSAYLLIPCYFIIYRRFSSISLIVIFVLSLCIFILKIGWLQFVFLKGLSGITNEFVVTKLFTYTTTFEAGRGLTANTIINILFYITTFIFAFYYRKHLELKNKYFNLFLNIYICQIVAYFALYEFIEMADRLRLYFLVANIVLLPGLVYLFTSVKERTLIFTYVFAFAFFSCKPYVLNSDVTIAYHPYQNYIIHKIFNLDSTGEERLKKHAEIHAQ